MDISKLNEIQRQAVLHTEGPLLILAGAGSGKTRVLTYRIAHLINDMNIKPYRILALTFTNKAAREMKERTEALVDCDGANDMWVMTFHSCCARILRMDGDKIGIERSFSIYSEDDKKSAINAIYKKLSLEDDAKQKAAVSHLISEAKNYSINPELYLAAIPEKGKQYVQIYKEYQKALITANALDFDDLLLTTLKLFSECLDVLEKYRSRFSYVLVDEYQDTNLPQYEFVHLLCETHRNICVVGDDDQSIYGWRGADIRNILEFEKDFPGATVIKLEQNYRSTGTILKAANEVIKNNTERKGKSLWTKESDGEPITHFTAGDEKDEAYYVARQISKGVNAGARYNDFAILYRTNAQSRVIESVLMSYGIPHKIYGGFRFYERAEIRDIMAYLRLLVNPDDDAAFRRIINVPTRGIGGKTLSALEEYAQRRGISLMKALRSPEAADNLTRGILAKYSDFISMMDELAAMRSTVVPSQLTQKLIVFSGYLEYLAKSEADYETRKENIDELLGVITEVEESVEEGDDALSEFLESAALVSDTDDLDENADFVCAMTMHSAKGLEFHTVFLIGFEESIFPSTRAIMEGHLDEERRLCYVAITRAMKKLHIINATRRWLYNRAENHRESQFLEEIPDFLMVHEGERLTGKGVTDAEYSGYSRSAYGGGSSARKGSVERTTTAFPQKKTTPAPAPVKPIAPKPPVRTAADPNTFRVGVRVQHETYGTGTITAVSGSGNATLVTIALDSGETKKFALSYAPLKVV